jgi:hypothetical protein
MFTWECPTCGREVDIVESECPNCSKKGKAAATAVATERAASERPGVKEHVAAPQLPPAQRSAAPRVPAQASWGLQGKHVAIFAVLALVAVAVAVYFARPDLFRFGAETGDVPVAEGAGDSGAAHLGDIEVAGVRTWYDSDYKPKVSAIVINHSESPQANVGFKVELRTREASTTDTPLASFEIRLKDALQPRESREIQGDLNAMGTLASLPPWHHMRVDLQPL